MFGWLFGIKTDRFYGQGRGSIKPYTRTTIEVDWKNIKVLIAGKSPSQLRQALITADKCLDNALRDMVTGETMGERLRNSPHLFEKRQYDKIWNAHKTRNALVHESGYEPPSHIILTSIENLKEALNSLGIRNI